jgi:hypothetical protein
LDDTGGGGGRLAVAVTARPTAGEGFIRLPRSDFPLRARGGAVGVPTVMSAGKVDPGLAEDDGGPSDDLSAVGCLRFLDVDDGAADEGVVIAATIVGASGLGGAVSSPSPRALSGWSAPPLAFFCLPSRLAIRREALPARRPLRRRAGKAIARKLIVFLWR